jgi:hypothetical protein
MILQWLYNRSHKSWKTASSDERKWYGLSRMIRILRARLRLRSSQFHH